jgi:hypothetical protein
MRRFNMTHYNGAKAEAWCLLIHAHASRYHSLHILWWASDFCVRERERETEERERERERVASACMRRHQAFALPPWVSDMCLGPYLALARAVRRSVAAQVGNEGTVSKRFIIL